MLRVAVIAAISLTGSLCPALGHAESCRGPIAPTTFPEPATATESDILTAQQNVKKYLAAMEDALKCLHDTQDTVAYNQAVDDMQRTATSFNVVLRAYRARQQKS